MYQGFVAEDCHLAAASQARQTGQPAFLSVCPSCLFGLPPPEFQETAHHFRVILRTQAIHPAQLDQTDRALLAFLQGSEGRSTAEIAAHLKKTPRTTQQRLARLQERRMAVAVGSSPKDPRRRWFPGPAATAAASAPLQASEEASE